MFDFDELEYHFQVANRTEDMPPDKKGILSIFTKSPSKIYEHVRPYASEGNESMPE